MNKIKLLLVDDHQLFLDGITASLNKEYSFEITAMFTKATEAFSFIKKQKVDLVITDISMPEVNGIEFINQVKKEHPTLKILILSMYHQLQPIDSIDGYLLKDVEPKKLINVIKNIVYKNEKHLEDKLIKRQIISKFNKSILTKREKEIVGLIKNEYSVDEISSKLFISRHTVETHKKNIFFKLKVKTNAGLVKKAIWLGV